MVLGTSLSLAVAAVAWIAARPMWAVGALVMGAVAVGGLYAAARSNKVKKEE